MGRKVQSDMGQILASTLLTGHVIIGKLFNTQLSFIFFCKIGIIKITGLSTVVIFVKLFRSNRSEPFCAMLLIIILKVSYLLNRKNKEHTIFSFVLYGVHHCFL
jgi:hypothetical protein